MPTQKRTYTTTTQKRTLIGFWIAGSCIGQHIRDVVCRRALTDQLHTWALLVYLEEIELVRIRSGRRFPSSIQAATTIVVL